MERPKPHEASTRLALGQVLATLAAHDLWAWCACDMPRRTGGGQAGNKGLGIVYRLASPDLPKSSRKRRST